MDRRNFIKTAGIAGIGALILPNSLFAGTLNKSKINIGLIGVKFTSMNY